MSIQDDYFDLTDKLKTLKNPEYLNAFKRIWSYMCELEADNDRIRPIVNGMREAIREMFKENE